MSNLDFPSGPSVGQVYQNYTWDGEKWHVSDPSLDGLIITVPPATLEKGLIVNQSPAGVHTEALTDVSYWHNGTMITDWNVNDQSNTTVPLWYGTTFIGDGCFIKVNGAAAHAPNALFGVAGAIYIDQDGPEFSSHYGGLLGLTIARQSTAGSGEQGHSITGINSNVAIETGKTGWTHICSFEADTTVPPGTPVGAKYGIAIVLGHGDGTQGSLEDAGIGFFNAPSVLSGWKYGIKFDQASRSVRVLSDDGVIIGVAGTQTVAKGLDFVGWNFTGNAIQTPQFTVSGTGSITTRHLVVSDDVAGVAQIHLQNVSSSPSALAQFTLQTTTTPESIVFIGLADQGHSPDYYFTAAAGVNRGFFRMGPEEKMRFVKGGETVFSENVVISKGASLAPVTLTLEDTWGNGFPEIRGKHAFVTWGIGLGYFDGSHYSSSWDRYNKDNGDWIDSPIILSGVDGHVEITSAATNSAADAPTFIIYMPDGLGQAFKISQNPQGTLTGGYISRANHVRIVDTVQTASAADFYEGWTHEHNVQTGHRGGRNSLSSVLALNGAPSVIGNQNYVAMMGLTIAAANLGGTGLTLPTAGGAIFGLGGFARAHAAATNLLGMTGIELNTEAQAGSSVRYKSTLQMSGASTDAVAGATVNAMVWAYNQAPSAVKWTDFILVDGTDGTWPMSTTGSIIRTKSAQTMGTVLDFSSLDVATAFVLKGPTASGVTIRGNGEIVTLDSMFARSLVARGSASTDGAVQITSSTGIAPIWSWEAIAADGRLRLVNYKIPVEVAQIHQDGTTIFLNRLVAGLAVEANSGAALVTGGTTAQGLKIGANNIGLHVGNGAPTMTAPKGSLYIRADATTTTTRLYINTTGAAVWANFTSSA